MSVPARGPFTVVAVHSRETFTEAPGLTLRVNPALPPGRDTRVPKRFSQ